MNGKHFGEGEEKKHLTTRESYEEKKNQTKTKQIFWGKKINRNKSRRDVEGKKIYWREAWEKPKDMWGKDALNEIDSSLSWLPFKE